VTGAWSLANLKLADFTDADIAAIFVRTRERPMWRLREPRR
jgi:hypothetical protein